MSFSFLNKSAKSIT